MDELLEARRDRGAQVQTQVLNHWAWCHLPPPPVSKIWVLTVGTLPTLTPTNLLDLPLGPMLSGLHSCFLRSLCPDTHNNPLACFQPQQPGPINSWLCPIF